MTETKNFNLEMKLVDDINLPIKLMSMMNQLTRDDLQPEIKKEVLGIYLDKLKENPKRMTSQDSINNLRDFLTTCTNDPKEILYLSSEILEEFVNMKNYNALYDTIAYRFNFHFNYNYKIKNIKIEDILSESEIKLFSYFKELNAIPDCMFEYNNSGANLVFMSKALLAQRFSSKSQQSSAFSSFTTHMFGLDGRYTEDLRLNLSEEMILFYIDKFSKETHWYDHIWDIGCNEYLIKNNEINSNNTDTYIDRIRNNILKSGKTKLKSIIKKQEHIIELSSNSGFNKKIVYDIFNKIFNEEFFNSIEVKKIKMENALKK